MPREVHVHIICSNYKDTLPNLSETRISNVNVTKTYLGHLLTLQILDLHPKKNQTL